MKESRDKPGIQHEEAAWEQIIHRGPWVEGLVETGNPNLSCLWGQNLDSLRRAERRTESNKAGLEMVKLVELQQRKMQNNCKS